MGLMRLAKVIWNIRVEWTVKIYVFLFCFFSALQEAQDIFGLEFDLSEFDADALDEERDYDEEDIEEEEAAAIAEQRKKKRKASKKSIYQVSLLTK